jgi:hypothetical protein
MVWWGMNELWIRGRNWDRQYGQWMMSQRRCNYYTETLSYDTPLMYPPFSEDFTLVKNWSLSLRRSSAASANDANRSVGYSNYLSSMPMITAKCYVLRNSPLFSGSSAFGSRNRYCSPTMTELRFKTGFQSSRRMFRHTFPSRSTFGW